MNTANVISLYDKILSVNSKSKYPFNLISNLKDNVIETKKEIELEYVKNFVLKPAGVKEGKGYTDILIYMYD